MLGRLVAIASRTRGEGRSSLAGSAEPSPVLIRHFPREELGVIQDEIGEG